MTAHIIDGKSIAQQLQQQLAKTIAAYVSTGARAPGLAVVLVGADAASEVYVNKKTQACASVGISSYPHLLPTETTQAELLKLIADLNQDPRVDGILVQLPLPAHIDRDAILDAIDPAKDVDGFHPYNLGLLAQGRPKLRPCTPYGIIKLCEQLNFDLVGKHAVVVGTSTIVGRPMALELLLKRCTVTLCHSKTIDLASHIARADIVVAAIGKPGIIKSEWLKSDAIVFDVGINRLPDGKLIGDIDFKTAINHAAWVTPVPGGVGPMTVAMLLLNTFQAANDRK